MVLQTGEKVMLNFEIAPVDFIGMKKAKNFNAYKEEVSKAMVESYEIYKRDILDKCKKKEVGYEN